MNSEKGSNKEDKNGFKLSDKQLKQLLAYDSGNNDFKVGTEKISKIAGDLKKPQNKLLKAAWGEKFAYAIVSVFDAFLMGVVIDFFAIVSFVLQFMVLLLIIVSPFALVLSFFPTLENILFNLLKTFGGTVIVSGLMTFASALFLFFYDILRTTTMALFANNLILAVAVNYIVIFVMWKKRDTLLSILTANRITSVNNGFTRRFSQAGQQFKKHSIDRVKASSMKRLALAGATVGGAYKLGKRKAGASVRHAGKSFKQQHQAISEYSATKRFEKKGYSYDKALQLARNKQIAKSAKYAGLRQRIGRTRALTGALSNHLRAEYYADDQDKRHSRDKGQLLGGQTRESYYREKAHERLTVANQKKQKQQRYQAIRESAQQRTECIQRITKPKQSFSKAQTATPKPFQVNNRLSKEALVKAKSSRLKRSTKRQKIKGSLPLNRDFSKIEVIKKHNV